MALMAVDTSHEEAAGKGSGIRKPDQKTDTIEIKAAITLYAYGRYIS